MKLNGEITIGRNCACTYNLYHTLLPNKNTPIIVQLRPLVLFAVESPSKIALHILIYDTAGPF